jgi:hypothetical protein
MQIPRHTLSEAVRDEEKKKQPIGHHHWLGLVLAAV